MVSGIAAGWIDAIAVARMLQNQLYGMHSFDLLTLPAAGVIMAGAGLAATWRAAGSAAARNPLDALKEN